MNFTVALRKNETGEVRHIDGGEWEDHTLFFWTEGNFGCDCNRYLCFERAGGHDPTDEEDDVHGDCGTDRYSMLYAEMADGSRVEVNDHQQSHEHG